MKQRNHEKLYTFIHASKMAFPYTVPVLIGYLFIGTAFGVMLQEKGYSFWWAILSSVLVYAGSGQYMMVNFFVPGIHFLYIIFMEFMVNIRHMFYGISFLERFHKMGKKKIYMMFALTDETYSLLYSVKDKVPKDVNEDDFYLAIALFDQSYWILGSAIGAIAGTFLPINSTGIDFAMSALLLVIVTEQWFCKENRIYAILGIIATALCRIIFGSNNFILPSMICILLPILFTKQWKEKSKKEEN